jgi:hypothetical protein
MIFHSLKLKNIDENFSQFKLVLEFFDKYSAMHFSQTPEIRSTLIELIESLKFKLDED